jgi:hypothetical protein
MATKTEMATEIAALLETLRKFQRDAVEKDARIAERDKTIAAQQATIATLEFRRVELVPLPQAAKSAGIEYETGRRWCARSSLVFQVANPSANAGASAQADPRTRQRKRTSGLF